MKRFLPFIVAIFTGAFALSLMLVKLAHADTGSGSAGSGSAVTLISGDSGSGLGSQVTPADAGSGSGSAVTPADKLHDPIANPAASLDDLAAARREGWPVLIFAILLLAARVVGRLGKSIPFLAKLDSGKTAVIVAGVLAVAVAGYNAAALGGSPVALITAVVAAALAYWNSHASPKAATA